MAQPLKPAETAQGDPASPPEAHACASLTSSPTATGSGGKAILKIHRGGLDSFSEAGGLPLKEEAAHQVMPSPSKDWKVALLRLVA